MTTLDPKKVNIRCTTCGSMAKWCESCKKFLCNRCKSGFKLEGIHVKKTGDKGCGCGGKK